MPMDEKIHLIGSAIADQAQAERQAIIDKANQTRESELAAYEEALISSMFGQVQQRTRAARQKAIKDKAQTEVQAHRELLGRREELTAAVVAGVRSQLLSYAATPEYRKALLEDLSALRDRWDHSSSTVFLRENDMELAGDIQKLLPGCKVEADPAIRLGGCKLLNRDAGILADETLDARLEAQKPWFLQNCGLKVAE